MQADRPCAMDAGVFCPLPGHVQSVPRAELFAVVLILCHVDYSDDVEIVSDSLTTVQTFGKGADHPAWEHSPNADLWREVWKHNPARVTMRWIKAHADVDPALFAKWGLDTEDVCGNSCADALAGLGAEEAAAMAHEVAQVVNLEHLVHEIQMRLVAILLHLVAEFPRTAVDRPRTDLLPRFSVHTLAFCSSHALSVQGDRYVCLRCGSCPYQSAAAIEKWFARDCQGMPVGFLKDIQMRAMQWAQPLPRGLPIVLGHKLAHRTHALFVVHNVVFCRVCGRFAAQGVRLLLHFCPGRPASATAQRNTRKLLAGERPSNLRAWPALSLFASDLPFL